MSFPISPVEAASIQQQQPIPTSMDKLVAEISKHSQAKLTPPSISDNPGTITILVGTSTAGKSTIVKELLKLEPDLIEDGNDMRCDIQAAAKMEELYPREIGFLTQTLKLTDIPPAVCHGTFRWKANVTAEEKAAAKETVAFLTEKDKAGEFEPPPSEVRHKEIADLAVRRAHEGQSTVFDVIDVKQITPHLPDDDSLPIKYVLTYLPFTHIATRMAIRTKEAIQREDFGDKRLGFNPLNQFGDIYTVVPKESNHALGILDSKEITTIYEKQSDAMNEIDLAQGKALPSAAELVEEREVFPKRLLSNLGAEEENGEFAIGPKPLPNGQDYLVVNSLTSTAADIAQNIHHSSVDYQRTSV